MIYYVMITKTLLWNVAREDDVHYAKYVKRRDFGFPPFEMLEYEPRSLISQMLHPDPQKRPEIEGILASPFMNGITVDKLTESFEALLSDDSGVGAHLSEDSGAGLV